MLLDCSLFVVCLFVVGDLRCVFYWLSFIGFRLLFVVCGLLVVVCAFVCCSLFRVC